MSTRFEKLGTRWVSSKWLNKPANPKTSLVNGEALEATSVHYSSWVLRNWSHLVPLKGLGEGRADWLKSLSRKKRDILFNLKEGVSLVAQMVKNLPSMQETWVWSLDLGRSSGEGNGNPVQCSCLENPTDRGAWQATVLKVSKSWTWLSD